MNRSILGTWAQLSTAEEETFISCAGTSHVARARQEGKREAATSNCAAGFTGPLTKYLALVKHLEPITKIVSVPVQIHSRFPNNNSDWVNQPSLSVWKKQPKPKQTITETSYNLTGLISLAHLFFFKIRKCDMKNQRDATLVSQDHFYSKTLCWRT